MNSLSNLGFRQFNKPVHKINLGVGMSYIYKFITSTNRMPIYNDFTI